MTKEKLISIIKNGKESALVDFKLKFYDDLKNSDLPKDLAAFANFVSEEPKAIVFGVDDETRNLVGIDGNTFISHDSIDDYISKTIEPFINTEVGILLIEDFLVGYIEILDNNNDYPYMIKKDCGLKNRIKQGDIFIRKGASVQKATREDLDRLKNKGNFCIRIHDSITVIEPIRIQGDILGDPTYGRINLEFFNETSNPVLIDDGAIYISSSKNSTCQRVLSILPNLNIREYPFEVQPISRKVYTLLYTFTSTECVNFGFDVDGNLDEDVKIKIMLKDTDDNVYESDEKELMIKVKGDILHKVWLMNKQNCKKKKNLKR